MSDCSTGTDSVDEHPPADNAESTGGGQSKRDHPSPSSALPPPKRSRRSVEKRVVSVPIAECGDRARTNGEGPPPPDSWAWRKYGQKPIKGSPYPRGYYRCSSSKGCPARKQVERSRADPTVLLVTYSYDHNHPWPPPRSGSTCHPTKSSPRMGLLDPKPQPGTPADCSRPEPAEHGTEPEAPEQEQAPQQQEEEEPEQKPVIGLADPTTAAAAGKEEEESFDYGWFDEYPTWHRTALYAPAFDVAPPEEWERELQGDDALFAGLGELPECAVVFGRRRELALPATAPCS